MRKLLITSFIGVLAQSCQLMSNSGLDMDYAGDSYSRWSKMKGEWNVVAEVQVGFEFFEKSEAEAKVKAKPKRKLLKEYFTGHFKEEKWRVCTTFKMIEEDSLEVIVADSRDTTARHYYGSFIEGFLSVVSPEGDEKLEMRLLDDRMVRKIFRAAPYKEEDWELVLHWEYERDDDFLFIF